MYDGATSICPDDLYARLGSGLGLTIIDIRPEGPDRESGRMIVSAAYCTLDEVERWSSANFDRPIVVYCKDGHDISQKVARALRAANFEILYLEGGIDGWIEKGLPTRRVGIAAGRRWVTRQRPNVDRIACPWLIRRFIDPRSEFLYVPEGQVLEFAKTTGATPYDMPGTEFGHHGDRCSFDVILSTYDIKDPALDHLALIVRGADTSRPDLAAECRGLLALSRGLSSRFADDREQLRHGMTVYDAFYQWCRLQQELIACTTVPIHSNGVVH